MRKPLAAMVLIALTLAPGAWGETVTVPGSVTQVPLDIPIVTTGGVAVFALAAGNRARGGWIQNPVAASADLCINEIDTAVGTVSSGNTTCIPAGQTYTISPGIGPVSVISSDSLHTFSGMGWK